MYYELLIPSREPVQSGKELEPPTQSKIKYTDDVHVHVYVHESACTCIRVVCIT